MSHRQTNEADLGALIRTGINNPIAIGLAESLLREAGIPFLVVDRNVACLLYTSRCV